MVITKYSAMMKYNSFIMWSTAFGRLCPAPKDLYLLRICWKEDWRERRRRSLWQSTKSPSHHKIITRNVLLKFMADNELVLTIREAWIDDGGVLGRQLVMSSMWHCHQINCDNEQMENSNFFLTLSPLKFWWCWQWWENITESFKVLRAKWWHYNEETTRPRDH